MSDKKQIKITNGDQTGYCLAESLKAWERHGWTRADDGSSQEPQNQPAQTESPAQNVTPRKAQ